MKYEIVIGENEYQAVELENELDAFLNAYECGIYHIEERLREGRKVREDEDMTVYVDKYDETESAEQGEDVYMNYGVLFFEWEDDSHENIRCTMEYPSGEKHTIKGESDGVTSWITVDGKKYKSNGGEWYDSTQTFVEID